MCRVWYGKNSRQMIDKETWAIGTESDGIEKLIK